MCSLMKRERLDLVLLYFTSLGLDPRGDVGLNGPILTLDRPDLQLETSCVGLTSVGGQEKISFLAENKEIIYITCS